MGADVKIVEPCNLYECELGDEVFVGPFVEIQRGVKVGAKSRIQSHSFYLLTCGYRRELLHRTRSNVCQ